MKPGELDLSDPESFRDGFPHPYFAMLRREAPVCFHEEPADGGPGFFVVSRYDDLRTVSRDPRTYSSWKGGTNLPTLPEETLAQIRALMLNMDPPQHVKYRRLVQKAFTPKRVAEQEGHIRELARRIVDDVAERGECDFVEDIAAELPLQVICEMVGVPQEDRKQIFELSNRLIGFDDPEYQTTEEQGKLASIELFGYAHRLAAERRTRPGDDLVTALLTAEVDGERLSELDFDSFFMLLLVAGNETTRNATTHGMRLLIEHPDQRRKLAEDPSLVAGAVEEIVRFTPPVMYFRRTLTRDAELHGQKLREGEKVALYYPSVNRDESVFPEPDRFDVTRHPNDHLGFGIGEHFCLGANLARLELRVIFEELIQRLPDMEFAGPVRLLRSHFIDGIKEMRVRYTPQRRTI